MRRSIILLLTALSFAPGLTAQETFKWTEKARAAVFSVITYSADDKIIGTGNGFYIAADGTAVSDFSLFKGAQRAVIVTADGLELPVMYIMGANEMYDVVKFKAAQASKPVTLSVAYTAPQVGETVYLLPYSTQKSSTLQRGTVQRVDTISGGHPYYTIDMQTADKNVSCPVMNAAGQVIGMVQKSASADSKESYAIGVGYASALSITAFSAQNSALNSIGIKKGLPEDESQALVYLYMNATQISNEDYLNLLNDFISNYPRNPEGYQRRATCYMAFGDDQHNALADADLKKSLSVADKKEDSYYNIAKILYSYNISLGDGTPYTGWDYNKALENIESAIKISDQPTYRQTQGDIYFAMQKYPEACEAYLAVCNSPMKSAQSFYSAAMSKELTEGADLGEVLALMDSAVAQYARPYGKETAPYVYERARIKTQLEKWREAVVDFNDFYTAMLGQVTADFYITREQAEVKGRMFKQAIDDVNKAVELEPQNVDFWVEKAGVHIRVNQLDEAIAALGESINIDGTNSGAYRMLGYCQVQKGDKEAGLANLQKAVELGDDTAASLIEKYK